MDNQPRPSLALRILWLVFLLAAVIFLALVDEDETNPTQH
jgi:hypothetical protein